MKKNIVVAVLSCLFCAWIASATAAPTGLVATEIVSQPTLGGYLQWNPVSGAVYDVYRGGNSECKGTFAPKLIASGVTATDYTDQPTGGLPFGEYCYAITAIVGGVASPYSNLIPLDIGNKWYGIVRFNTTPVTYCNQCDWVLKDLDNNTIVFNVKTNSQGNATFTFRADCGNYELTLALPDGKIIIDDKTPFPCAGFNVAGIGSTTHFVNYDEGLGLAPPYINYYITQSTAGSPIK